MTVFLIGAHLEILRSLVQDVDNHEIRIILHGLVEGKSMGEISQKGDLLFVFDLNNPIDEFNNSLHWIQKHFPAAPIWAIFDSESLSLREEILRLGFQNIISYQQNLLKLLEALDID